MAFDQSIVRETPRMTWMLRTPAARLAVGPCWRRWGIACVISLALQACGGGSGSEAGGDGTPTPPTSATTVAGRVGDPRSGGGTVPAAGRTVELLRAGADGLPTGSALASTVSDGNGLFSLRLPDGLAQGPELMLRSTTESGVPVHALALGSDVRLDVGSEAFVRQLQVALAGRTEPLTAEVQRLTRLQSAATLMTELLDAASTTTDARIDELSFWLARDRAFRGAVASLRDSGNLPATLEDVGGIMGVADGAWIISDSAYGERAAVLTRRSGAGARFDGFTLRQSYPSSPWAPDSMPSFGLGVDEDVVTQWQIYTEETDELTRVITGYLVPARQFRIGQSVGETYTVNYLPVKTSGYSFDNDGEEDDLTRQVVSTVTGFDTIEVFGRPQRTLRIEVKSTLTIALTGGGEFRLVEDRVDWCMPLAGVVRSESRLTVSAPGRGTEQTDLRTVQLQRGVQDGVSWPDRVLQEDIEVNWPDDVSRLVPIGLTSRRQILVADYVDYKPARLFLVDPDTGRIMARSRIDDLPYHVNRLVLSRDGSRLFVVSDRNNGGRNLSYARNLDALPKASADAAGARVVQIDTSDLGVLSALALPALPTRAGNGMAYPRDMVGRMLPSPSSPNRLLLETLPGPIVVEGGTTLPRTWSELGGEFTSGSSMRLSEIRPTHWVAETDEIRFAFLGFAESVRQGFRVPVGSDGLDLARRATAPLHLVNGFLPDVLPADQAIGGIAYTGNLSTAFDLESTTILGEAMPRTYSDTDTDAVSPCHLTATMVLCTEDGDLVVKHPRTLAVAQRFSQQFDLLRASGRVAYGTRTYLIELGVGDAVTYDTAVSSSEPMRRLRYLP